jgi:hypothetical protein
MDFGSHVVLPDGVKLMVEDDSELLELWVRLWASPTEWCQCVPAVAGRRAAQRNIARLLSQAERTG